MLRRVGRDRRWPCSPDETSWRGASVRKGLRAEQVRPCAVLATRTMLEMKSNAPMSPGCVGYAPKLRVIPGGCGAFGVEPARERAGA